MFRTVLALLTAIFCLTASTAHVTEHYDDVGHEHHEGADEGAEHQGACADCVLFALASLGFSATYVLPSPQSGRWLSARETSHREFVRSNTCYLSPCRVRGPPLAA
jgi:hypothetical protein